MQDIGKSGYGAAEIKLVIYNIKILYFNHRITWMSNTFSTPAKRNKNGEALR